MPIYQDLWGEEFSVPQEEDTKLLEKIKKPKKVTTVKSYKNSKITLEEHISLIAQKVYSILGQHKEDTLVIKTKEEFSRYIDKSLSNGIITIDTETNNSLDPLTCKLMGLCLHTPNEKQCYIPINHINFKTRERLDWQLTEEDCREQLQRVIDGNIKTIFHNGKFDYEVLKCTCGVHLPIYWDTLIGARLLNENELANLKEQYMLHIDSNHSKYDIESLFEKEEYAIFDPELFALYAATDAMMTYKLYLYQLEQFNLVENKRVYSLFREVELPCIEVIAEMELRGVVIDLEYCSRLANKYHNILSKMEKDVYDELDKYKDKIAEWKISGDARTKVGKKNKVDLLDDPINLGSPSQMAILIYDILGCDQVSKKKPRGTGKEELEALDEKYGYPFFDALLSYKTMKKLVESFLDVLPSEVNEKTGRIHCNYNQIGADTGRQSCSDPNLQQIPSHNKEIRLMFKAQDGYVLAGSDFSQQEPRLLSFYSQDDAMINAYKEGKDLYSTIASKVYHNKYEDNLEHYPDGSINEDGKNRRTSVKSLLLGMMYGMQVPSIAKKINSTTEEAQEVMNSFFEGFPKVKKWIDDTEKNAMKTGYVEDWYGRKRRLDNLLLPMYDVVFSNDNEVYSYFNPFLGCKNRVNQEDLIAKYKGKLKPNMNKKAFYNLKQEAKLEGVDILSNEFTISADLRKCVNARIQGGAATMTKVAMIKLYNDEELNRLGFHLLISVHDELIGECPKENGEKVAERLSYIMRTCIEDKCNVPFKCDAEVTTNWYMESYLSVLNKEYKNLLKTYSKEEAFNLLCESHTESLREQIQGFIDNNFKLVL